MGFLPKIDTEYEAPRDAHVDPRFENDLRDLYAELGVDAQESLSNVRVSENTARPLVAARSQFCVWKGGGASLAGGTYDRRLGEKESIRGATANQPRGPSSTCCR